MDPLVVALLIVALVLSGLAAFGVAAARVNLLAAAFACYVLSVLVPMF
jgi:hypothetical protein